MNANDPRTKLIPFCLALVLTGAACSGSSTEAQSGAAKAEAAEQATRFGEKFAAGKMTNVNAGAGGPAEIDLGAVLGARPVVLYYWIAGNPRADQMFQEVQELVARSGPDKVALFGVVYRRSERDVAAVAERVGSLGITVPVLDDVEFQLGTRLRVQSVPNVTIFDKDGRLRLTNGASPIQELEYKMNLGDAIRRVAETGQLGTYGYLSTYYPVKEMVGKPCPDFKAPLLSTSVEQRWSSLLAADKLNVLIFWSVDCPHCRKSLPEISAWLKQNGEGVNVFSAAKVTSEASRIKTREFCDINGLAFPTLVDEDNSVSGLFQVTSTPTILFIRPDGVIDSVMLSSEQDFGAAVERRKKELL